MGQRKHLRFEDLTILIDSREQRPLEFLNPEDSQKPLQTKVATLTTGDYSILGFEKDEIAIERKSLPDLVHCVGGGRERFEKELHRLLGFKSRLVVVEASWDEIILGQWRSTTKPNQVMGSIAGWIDMGIPFFLHHDRRVVANFVRNILFIHARRFHERLLNLHPTFRIGEKTEEDPVV